MWGSSRIVNVKRVRLNHLFRKTKPSKHIWSRNFGFSSLPVLEDENFVLEKFGSTDSVSFPCATCDFIDAGNQDDISCRGNDFISFVVKDAVTYKIDKLLSDKFKAVKNILAKRGWFRDSQNDITIDLDQFKTIKILNDLYEESFDASVALYFFRWSALCIDSGHSIRCVSRMIHILVSGNMNHRAVDLLLRLVKKCSGEESSCNLLLKTLYEMHTDRWALKTVLSMLVDCCIKERKVDMAIRLTRQMEYLNMFPSMGVCNSLLRALLRLHKLELAWEFLEHMLDRGMHLNASIISLFIDRYCSDGNFEEGWKLLRDMKHHGIRPDVVAYTIVIDNLCKASWLKEATSLLFKIIQLGVCVDSVLVSSIVDGYYKVGNPEKAIRIMKLFRLKPNIFVYNSFLLKLCGEGNMLKASKIVQEISEADFLPDTVCYTTLIGGYCKAGEINKAFQYFGRLLKSGNPPSVTTYTLLVDACCKFGDIGEAESLFQNMIIEGLVPDVVAYNSLMHGYGKKGHLSKVFELLDIMRSADVSPEVATYNILIHSMVSRGYVHEAKDIMDELTRRGFVPDVVTFTNIIDGFSKKGNFEEAFLLWFYMSDLRVKPDVVTCNALLNGYCRIRLMDEANSLFIKMLDAGLEPDLILYNTLIHGFCSIGDIDKASEVVDLMVQKGIFPNDITHCALVLGFEKKWVEDPVKRASMRVEEILLRYGVRLDMDQYMVSIKRPIY